MIPAAVPIMPLMLIVGGAAAHLETSCPMTRIRKMLSGRALELFPTSGTEGIENGET